MKELKAVKTTNAQLEESNRVLEEYTKEQQEIINQLEAELRAAKQNNSKKESV
jgi:HPt (histidine-containing phosphotransfer) domain-containing protein